MCAEYNLKTSERDFALLLNISLLNQTEDSIWDRHLRLYDSAPILIQRQEHVALEDYRFSLLPPGSAVRFTANARLDDWNDAQSKLTFVYDRPTWRESFLERRCLIPVSDFLEPIYRGPHAGQMVRFSSPDTPVLFVAGIYKETLDVKTGQVFKGFAMLTDFAHPTVASTGHHRTIVLLGAESALAWIGKNSPKDPRSLVQFLLRSKDEINLQPESARHMKSWKSRIKANDQKFENELRIQPLVAAARAKLGL